MVEVTEEGRIHHVWGNPHALGGQQLCPRGVAGKAFEYDDERPQYPVIRRGARGEGKWERLSWQAALDLVAERLRTIKQEHGARAVVLSDRGGPHREFHQTFLRAFGSPNYVTHHASCSNSVHNAHMSITGLPRNGVAYDYKRCKHLVCFGRNLFESLGTGEAKQVIDMLERGARFDFFDVRWNFTAAKATSFHLVRPGSDYAIVLALLRTVIDERLYDAAFVDRWVNGMPELAEFLRPHTPAEAERQSGIPAERIVRLARQLGEAAPAVIVHPGWMTAWRTDDFYLRRAIYALNALLGAYEAPGGLALVKGPSDAGVKLKQLSASAPAPESSQRFDGAGAGDCCHLGKGWGLAQTLPRAIMDASPYPIRAYIAMRHDPLASLPDPGEFITAFDKLDLVVAVDVNWSETAWHADVVLPESTYLERTDYVIERSGLKPKLALRRKAVEPTFDSKPRWWIFRELALRLGIGEYFPYESAEEHVAWQLAGTPYSLEDFDATGEIALGDSELWLSRENGLRFKTPSGKIELFAPGLAKAGVPAWVPPAEMPPLAPGTVRLITGKTAIHTQGRTTANNPLLNEIISTSPIQIHPDTAASLGISDGDAVEIGCGEERQKGVVQVTDLVHPEVAFLLHGFGDSVPIRTRSYGKGINDGRLCAGQLRVGTGGNCTFTEGIVTVRRAENGGAA
jgi:thiosulfate reductase/polysulfide reductase chain A